MAISLLYIVLQHLVTYFPIVKTICISTYFVDFQGGGDIWVFVCIWHRGFNIISIMHERSNQSCIGQLLNSMRVKYNPFVEMQSSFDKMLLWSS